MAALAFVVQAVARIQLSRRGWRMVRNAGQMVDEYVDHPDVDGLDAMNRFRASHMADDADNNDTLLHGLYSSLAQAIVGLGVESISVLVAATSRR